MGATITESVNISVDENVNVNDGVSIADAIVVALVLTLSVFSGVTVAEDVTVFQSNLGINVSESVGVAEDVTLRVDPLHISVDDSVSVAELVEVVFVNLVSVSDSISVAEDVTAFLSIYVISVNDSIALSEAVTAQITVEFISVDDSISLVENIGISAFEPGTDLTPSVSDAVSITESVTVLIPVVGDRFIVGAGATGDWSGEDTHIAVVDSLNPTVWSFITPKIGYTLYVRDEDLHYKWNGTAWTQIISSIVAYGELYAQDANETISVTLTGKVNKVRITTFDTNGESQNVTSDHTLDSLVVALAGRYLVTVSIAIISTAGGGDLFGFGLFTNNGLTGFANIHAHRNMSGGGGDAGSVSMSGIIVLPENGTVELWVWNEDDASDIIVDDVTMSINRVGD